MNPDKLGWLVRDEQKRRWWKAGSEHYTKFRKDAGVFSLNDAMLFIENAEKERDDLAPQVTLYPVKLK